MKLFNATTATAALLHNGSPTSARHAMGCVVARRLFAIDEDGSAEPLERVAWPVGTGAVRTPFGESSGDKPFYKGGVDVLLAGSVYAEDGIPAARFDVELEIGRTFRRRIAVFGDRTWVRRDGALIASDPKPLGVMRLHARRAYGGRSPSPGGELVPFPWNAEGRGHHLDATTAEGAPLPNLEHPARLVASWSDRPAPVGLGIDPSGGALAALYGVDHPLVARERALVFGDAGGEPPAATGPLTLEHLSPRIFNEAHPEMVIDAAKSPRAGDVVRLSRGRRGGGDLTFRLPDRALHVFVQLEKRGFLLPMVLDQIGIVAGAARLLLGWRVVFEYRVVRGERRFVTLHEGAAPRAIPEGYRRRSVDAWDDDAEWGAAGRAQGSPGPSSS